MIKAIRKKSLFKNFRSSDLSLAFLGIILAAVAIGFAIHTLKGYQNTKSHAQTVQSNPNRITWQGKSFYINGANVPWYNWSCDFGCNANGGVSGNLTNLSAGFAQAQAAGMHVLRWWVFPGNPWQINTDSTGAPASINPAVYADFDAALQLAQQYDMYYDFVLFSGPTAIPTTWETDATQQADLARVLGTLFAHYASNPRILSWEIYNEPDFDIDNGKISQQAVVSTAQALTQSVHTNSPGTLVTIGMGFADAMSMFNGIGLDYYSPHWYDYMNSGTYCIICNTYSTYASSAENKPIVVGEYPTETSTTTPYSSSYRLNYWYNNGFAGAWAWSLFPNQTSDKLAIDFAAEQAFASQHSDIGPVQSGVSPTPTPGTLTPTPVPGTATLSVTPTTQSVTTGQTVSVNINENSGNTPVNAMQTTISYPSNLLTETGINYGNAFGIQAAQTIGNGTITIARGANPAVSGNNAAITIQFQAVSSGNAVISLSNSQVLDSQTNQNIFSTAANGTINIAAPTPTQTPSPTPTSIAIIGDINGDGVVDLLDISILLSHWLTNYAPADLNHDGVVNLQDISILLSHW